MATYFLVILVTLGLMSIYILGVLSENLYENERVKLFAKANIISDTIAPYLLSNEQSVEEDVVQILAGSNVRGIVVNTAYTVLLDTTPESNLKSKIFTHDIIKIALSGEQSASLDKQESKSNTMSVCVPVKHAERITGAVYLMTTVDDIDIMLGHIQASLYIFSMLISILVGMLSLGMSYILTSPMDEFMSVAKEISKGNFSRRVKAKGHNELAEMAQTLNYMCDELETLDERRKKFVSDASHELKTPLATIKLICDSLVTTEKPDMNVVREFLGDLSDEVDRLTRIIERLLALTKLDSGNSTPRFESVDLTALVQAVIRKLTPIADAKDMVLYAQMPEEETKPMMLDFDKMWEAVYNVTDNAIKYSPEGGFVKVCMEWREDAAVITVEDNGPGIPDEEKERVFERFYRLDDSRARDTGGTGLGLAIAKEAVLMHDGTITIDSHDGMGSIFTIILPYTTL